MTVNLWQNMRGSARNLASVLALGAALGVGASVSPAQALGRDGKDDTAYTIKRIYKALESDRYRVGLKMNMESPVGAVDMVETMVMKELTKAVKEDGGSTTVFDFESASITVNGMDIDLTPMLPKIVTTRDKDGKSAVKIEGGDEALTAQMGEQVKQYTNFGSAFIPAKPVKVGDSWDVNASEFGSKDQTVKGKVTFVSVDTVKGVKVAKLKSVMDITGANDLKMHSDTTTLVDLATGKALDMTSKTDGNTGGGKLSMEMSMRLLGPDDKSDGKQPIKKAPDVKKP